MLDHVEPPFYRSEAVGAIRPIGAAELPAALRSAYAIRSRNVHSLETLASEMWVAAQRADTALVEGERLLSLEGLARLSRHVIRRFVERAPRGVDPTFDYDSALPGILRARLAPQYWIHQAGGFNRGRAPAYFGGMLEFLIEGLSGRSEAGLTDMTGVLDEIERTALSLADSVDRVPMAGIMALWNGCAPEGSRRNIKKKLQACLESDLAAPSMTALSVRLVLGVPVDWPPDALKVLADARRTERTTKDRQRIPKRIDAALHVLLADRLLASGDRVGGIAELAHAVETVPGLEELMGYEAAIARGEDPIFDLRKFILGEAHFVAAEGFDDAASATDKSTS